MNRLYFIVAKCGLIMHRQLLLSIAAIQLEAYEFSADANYLFGHSKLVFEL
jgi:hypothetical protein